MPLLESFSVDHTRMSAPAVRTAKTMKTPHGDTITVFDLRFYLPNQDMMSERGMHTLEHLFAGFMRHYLDNPLVEIIDLSPMGCRTGFYMSVIGSPNENDVIQAWQQSMSAILALENQTQIPELNQYQCGAYQMHSLHEAQHIAQMVQDKGIVINHNDLLHLTPEALRVIASEQKLSD